jgi:putative spermidine/putrescine transport system permease protein
MLGILKKLGAWGAVLPLLGYCAIALGLPIWAILWSGLHLTDPNNTTQSIGSPTLANLTASWHGIYLTGLLTSLRLSLLSSVISAVVGIFAAYAIAQSRGRYFKQAILTASGVLANFGGIPLAFCFIATIGTGGVFLSWIDAVWPSFSISDFDGVAVVYPYFLVPLMVLTTLPALDGLREQWKEASANLGGGSWQYWRYVGAPLLLPAALGGFVLCFGSAFAAYATAKALTSGTVPLVTTQIANILSGNVIAGENNLGMALAFNTIIICGLMMAVYLPLRKRSAKWLES